MSTNSAIEWTHHTFNPWWGCTRVSPGCEHCYAETFDRRVHGRAAAHWGVQAARKPASDKYWSQPLNWDRNAAAAGERRRVFCASMADVMEDRRDLDVWRLRLWALVEATPHLDWLLLTKRPENFVRLLPQAWLKSPRLNVWLGTTGEDRQRMWERSRHLLATPAALRFYSMEPLLEDVMPRLCPLCGCVTHHTCGHDEGPQRSEEVLSTHGAGRVDWVIVGGESGHGARPCDVNWVREVVSQCTARGCVVFVKQLGSFPVAYKEVGTAKGGSYVPLKLRDPKGGDPSEWPEDLRVREFPRVEVPA